jgi:hypothetical protein
MPKAEVFLADSNPACDRPAYYCKIPELEALVRLKRAVQIGPRSFHLIPLHIVLESQTGYDRASTRGVTSTMLSVWQVRKSAGIAVWQMGHEGKCRETSHSTRHTQESNGFPDRMHIRKEADEFALLMKQRKL